MAKALGDQVTWVGSVGTGDGAHEGHGGWAISGISKHLDEWLSESQPDLVVLVIGTNDAAGDRDPGVMLGDLKSLVTRITSRNIQVVLGTIPPYPAKASIQAEYNQGIRDSAKSLGITLADLDKILSSEDLASDKIHLNQAGNKKAGSLLVEKIREAMKAQASQAGVLGWFKRIPIWKLVASGLVAGLGIYLVTRSEP
jgi:lysophospholipase L1-like esterase